MRARFQRLLRTRNDPTAPPAALPAATALLAAASGDALASGAAAAAAAPAEGASREEAIKGMAGRGCGAGVQGREQGRVLGSASDARTLR